MGPGLRRDDGKLTIGVAAALTLLVGLAAAGEAAATEASFSCPVSISVGLMAMDRSGATLVVTRNYADDPQPMFERHRAATMATCSRTGP
jgi:hypothetical protein